MKASDKDLKVSSQQQRIVKLLFKFRYISAQVLAQVMGKGRASVYLQLESLVRLGLVTRVYGDSYRIDRKPAYYYLNKAGVTYARKIMGVKESVVHTLYKNDVTTEDFVEHCLMASRCFVAFKQLLPNADIYSRSEINRYSDFPKNKPDMYIRMPDENEAFVFLAHDKPMYIVRKRFDEVITHHEDEGWEGGYPTIVFILKDARDTKNFIFTSRKKLDNMGMREDEIRVLAADLGSVLAGKEKAWVNVMKRGSPRPLFDA